MEKKILFSFISLILAVLVSTGFFIAENRGNKRVMTEITGVTSELLPTHKCDENGLELYCFSLSSSFKTCYTLPDSKGGKRCLTEPLWKEIIYDDPIVDCPICDVCPTCNVDGECPLPTSCPEPTKEKCDIIYSGGGGSCNNDCPETPKCELPVMADKITVIAYTDNGKYFCDGIGIKAKCVKDGTLEMPFS